MKIGILSDTHLTEVTPRFENVLHKHLNGVDMLFHAGDIVGYPVYSYLQQFTIHAVAGNMDSPVLREILPANDVINLENKRIGLIHGWGVGSPMEKRLAVEFCDVDAIVFGHTHRPVNQVLDGILYFNPGSTNGNPPKFPPSIGILDVNKNNRVRGEIIYLAD